MADIIDLTVSPQREIIEISSDQANTPGRRSQAQVGKKRKKKKRKPHNGLSSDGPTNSSAQPSRAHSQEIENEPGEPNSQLRPQPQFTSTPRRTTPPTADEPGLFFFDHAATQIARDDSPAELREPNGDDGKLLLPSHVTIFHGNGPTTSISVIPSPKPSSDDEQYIEYLDYDDRKGLGLIRYFELEEQANQSRSSVFKCRNCGAEGDHKSYDCPVLICLTCGARDEHSTRSCPISKTCYTCGMKGHINKTCPNRLSAHATSSNLHGECTRCGSIAHKVNECPTLWRIYQYVNEEERALIIQSREQKKRLALGDGGEAYIGREMWCYNCAGTGHLGDDCDELPHPSTMPTENSAFSSDNVTSGPFYDPATELVSVERGRREDDDRRRLPDDWEEGAPVDVGKRGKNKNIERLEKRFRETQEDEGEDWFNDIRNVKRRGMDRQAPPPAPQRGRFKIRTLKDESYDHSSPPTSLSNGGLSLLERISDAPGGRNRRKVDDDRRELPPQIENPIRIRGAATEQRNQEGKYSSKTSRGRGRESGDKAGGERGPRYKGSYDR